MRKRSATRQEKESTEIQEKWSEDFHGNMEQNQEIDPDTFQFKALDDFKIYNKWARKNGHPVRVPTEEYHPKVKVKFQRFDQPDNVLKARLYNKDIDWTGQLKPGGIYELPMPVVKFLNSLAVPKFAEVEVNDGGPTRTETKQVGEINRFSCQVLDFV